MASSALASDVPPHVMPSQDTQEPAPGLTLGQTAEEEEVNTPCRNNGHSSSKFGKLGIANLLIRRKLKRQYFDSADYSMDQTTGSMGMKMNSSSPTTWTPMHSPVVPNVALSPMTNHTKIDDSTQKEHDRTIECWKQEHPVIERVDDGPLKQESLAKKESSYGRLCARNILLRKKLTERKRFDSADYFIQNA